MRPLGFAIKEWMEVYKQNEVKQATYERLESSYKLMLQFQIANVDVASLTSGDIQKYINKLVNRGYSLSTVKKQYLLLTAYFRFAYSQGLVPVLVTMNVKMPRADAMAKPPKDIQPYTRMEQMALLKVLRTREYICYCAAELMLETGLRVGEALALTWDDIDLDRECLTVSKTMRFTSGKTYIQNSPKSKSSRRTIPLSRNAVDVIEYLYSRAEKPEGLLFTCNGEPIAYTTMSHRLEKACKLANVPYRGSHALRHTFATNCYHKGCDVKLLSKMLGHASAAITYNIYIHLYGDSLEEMRAIVK